MRTSERSPRGMRARGRALALLGSVIILAACGVGTVASPPSAEPLPTPDFTPWEMPTPDVTPWEAVPTPEPPPPTPAQPWIVPVRNDGAEPVRLIEAEWTHWDPEAVASGDPESVQPGEWLNVVLPVPPPPWEGWRRGLVFVEVQVGTAELEQQCTLGYWGLPMEVYVDAAGQCWVGERMAQQGGPPPPLPPDPYQPYKPLDRGCGC